LKQGKFVEGIEDFYAENATFVTSLLPRMIRALPSITLSSQQPNRGTESRVKRENLDREG
jgi:hypothetical protein